MKWLFIFLASSLILACGSDYDELACDSIQNLELQDSSRQAVIAGLNKIISVDPFCLEAYNFRGDLLSELGNLELAESDYLYVLQVDPGQAYALFKMGALCFKLEKYKEAIEYYDRILEEKFKSGYAIDFNAKLKEHEDRLDVNTRIVIFNQAVSYFQNRDMEGAKLRFDYCISQNISLGESYMYRGKIFLGVGDTVLACDDLVRASALGNIVANNLLRRYCNVPKSPLGR